MSGEAQSLIRKGSTHELPLLLFEIVNYMKTALITGITGQDGSYLAEFCWKKDMTCMER